MITTTTPTDRKCITIETNYNLKMGCPWFIHVDLAPTRPVTEGMAERTTIEIRTQDGTFPPILVRLAGLVRLPLEKLCSIDCFLSHGLSPDKLKEFLLKKYPQATATSEVGIYLYTKI